MRVDRIQAGSLPAILFLDFDGVVHPGLSGTFCYLDRVEALLDEQPNILVVISSTWRLDHDFDSELKPLFSVRHHGRILGCTPDLPHELRETEILMWRRKSGLLQLPWAALDDDPALFMPGCPNLVVCDPARGVRTAQLNAIRELLTKKPQHSCG